MRTTLDIPVELIEEAQRLLGFKSKTDTVIVSLRNLIRRRRIDELKVLMGSVQLDIDLSRVDVQKENRLHDRRRYLGVD